MRKAKAKRKMRNESRKIGRDGLILNLKSGVQVKFNKSKTQADIWSISEIRGLTNIIL